MAEYGTGQPDPASGMPQPSFGGGYSEPSPPQAEPSAPMQSGEDDAPTPPWAEPAQPQGQAQAPEQPSRYGWQPGMPMPGEPGGPPPMPDIDPNLLNTAVVQAREAALHAQFKPAYDAAPTEHERRLIEQQYTLATERFRLMVERAQMAHDRWQEQVGNHNTVANLVPKLRELHATELADRYKGYGLTAEKIMRDETGRQILTRQEMDMRAYYMAKAAYDSGVRIRGGRDTGLTPVGGQAAAAPGDISNMSREQFLQFREQVKRSGGALLHRIG